jgi:hypothetical protein
MKKWIGPLGHPLDKIRPIEAADIKCYAFRIVEARPTDVRLCITGSISINCSENQGWSMVAVIRKRRSGGDAMCQKPT